MKLTGFALACAAVLSACTAAPMPEYTNDVPHSIPLNGHVRLLEEVSEIRRAQGLSIVASSAGADQAAHRAAADMARHGTFSHTGSDGSSAAERLRDAGCSGWTHLGTAKTSSDRRCSGWALRRSMMFGS